MSYTQDELKELAGRTALKYVKENEIIGIGSGSTVRIFISLLKELPFTVKGAVAASVESEQALEAAGIKVFQANEVDGLDVYFDGADEITKEGYMTKGGGAALTREKIVAELSKKFICLVDETKTVDFLGQKFPLPVEVIPMARSQIARKLVAMGGMPTYRAGCVTDNQCQILDVKNFPIMDAAVMEKELNNIPGIVTNGIFARNRANLMILATKDGIKEVDFDK